MNQRPLSSKLALYLTLPALLLTTGCKAGDFWGEDSQVCFDTDLSRPFRGWNPESGLATGSEVTFDAVDFRGHDGTQAVAPASTPSITGGASAVEVVSSGEDQLTLKGLAPGDAVVDFAGADADHSDRFTLKVRDPATLTVGDPILAGLGPDFEPTVGTLWPDLEDGITVIAGSESYFDLILEADDGTFLGFQPGDVSASLANDAVTVAATQQGLVLTTPTATGLLDTLTLTGPGGVTADLTIANVAPTDVTDIEFTAYHGSGLVVVHAQSFAGLFPVYAAPTEWEVPDFLVPYDPVEELGFAIARPDIAVYTFEGDPGVIPTAITARVGSAEATITLDLVIPEPDPEPQPLPDPEPVGCSCGPQSSSGGGAAFFLPFGLMVWVRLRRFRV